MGKFIDKVQHYFRPFFKTNLPFFFMLRTILAFRSVTNHFLGMFRRGDPPEPPPQILGKPKNHFFCFSCTLALSF